MALHRDIWDWKPELIWRKYCGFLELSQSEFNNIQQELLMEQLRLVHDSPLGRRLLRGSLPKSVSEFRRYARLTKFGDYLPELESPGNDAVLSEPAHYWVHTTGARAEHKYVPYTRRGYDVVVDNLLAAFILGCATRSGEVNLRRNDIVMFNTPPRPFLSGLLTFEMVNRFGLGYVLSPEEAEGMEFKERIEKGFRKALGTNLDILISMSSILVKIGEEFAERQKKSSFSPAMLHPAVLSRLARAKLKSVLNHRPILPRDIWSPKTILAWGVDTPFFRKQVEYYWGVSPYQFYACTEGGVMALQAWNRKGMTLIPYSNFYEFIPEDESAKSWEDPEYRPATLLSDELEPGKRYEIVMSSFYGMPLMRYRVGHLVRALAKEDTEAGIRLPQLEFESRADDRIDLAGFTRMDEKTFWEALEDSRLGCVDWIVRKEYNEGSKPLLRLYGVFKSELTEAELSQRLDAVLMEKDPFYRDLQQMLDIHPLRVTRLAPNAFERYYDMQTAKGLPLPERRPSRMNAGDAEVFDLCQAGDAVLAR